MSGLTEFPVSLALKLFWSNAANESQSLSNEILLLPPKGWEIACKIRISSVGCFTCRSLMAVFYISLERFICIHFPLEYPRIMTKHRVAFAIVVKWILSCIIATAFVLLIGEIKLPCDPSLINESFINGFIIPFIVVFLLTSLTFNLKISCTAYKQSKEIACLNQETVHQNHETSEPQFRARVTERDGKAHFPVKEKLPKW